VILFFINFYYFYYFLKIFNGTKIVRKCISKIKKLTEAEKLGNEKDKSEYEKFFDDFF